MPNTYARGILFGKMVLELGDVSSIRNDRTDHSCDVEFRTKVRRCPADPYSMSVRAQPGKAVSHSMEGWRDGPRRGEADDQGWISGGYNAIAGRVNGPGHAHVGDISGHWHDVIDFADKKKGKKTTVFDAKRAKMAAKFTLAEDQQEENESRRWV